MDKPKIQYPPLDIYVIVAILCSICGRFAMDLGKTGGIRVMGQGLFTLALVFFGVAIARMAKKKGRSRWWGLFGILHIFGLIVPALLKDKTKDKS